MYKVRSMRKVMKKGVIITILLLFFMNCMVPLAMADTIKPLEVLEVQPGTEYQLLTNYPNIANYDVHVTQMPMSQFISTVDGLNGKYDIIVIGNKSYNESLAGGSNPPLNNTPTTVQPVNITSTNLLHYKIPYLSYSSSVTTTKVTTTTIITTKTTKHYYKTQYNNNHSYHYFIDTTVDTATDKTITTSVTGSTPSTQTIPTVNTRTGPVTTDNPEHNIPNPDTVISPDISYPTPTEITTKANTYTYQTEVPIHYSAEGDHFAKLNNNPFTLPQGGTTDSSENYSPNDITSRRAAMLQEFVQSGQLTVFADSIFTSDDLKNTILNKNFKAYNSSIYPNFYKDTTTNTNDINITDLVNKYATSNKRPSLTVTSNPLEYDGLNAQTDSDKTMSFGFDVSGPNLMVASLFVDINGDGVFSDTEKAKTTENIRTNNPVEGHLALNYRIPDSYTGLQPWKLELEDTVTHTKYYKTGFTAYSGTPLNIRVLQLVPSGNLLNIKTDMPQLLSKPGEYNISVTVMNVTTFDNNYPNVAATTTAGVSAPTKLDSNYDMVIMGFDDMYGSADLKKDLAIQGLKDFIKTGQSVMFTHDTMTFFTNNVSGWDYNLTKEFRDIIGQNIYNKDALNPSKIPSFLYIRLFYPFGSTKSYGFTRLALDRANNGDQFPTSTIAKKLNDGLITKYPYVLSDTLAVATTHYQYYQLDLEDPSLVPWFTLKGDGYNSLDGRNDYYTYSKGNITYSGTGHSTPNNLEEQRLFVNTIIKAARGANHAPTVDIYDLNDGQEIYTNQTRLDFSFKASDLDLIKDSNLKANISITDNSTHITTQVTDFQVDTAQANLDTNHAFSLQNNSIVKISMPKTIADTTSNFSITVTAQDTSLATGFKTITLNQVSPPSLTVSTTGSKNFLIHDTGDTTFNIAPFSLNKDMTNIKLIIDKDQTGICQVTADTATNITQDDKTITINVPPYVALAGDVNHWIQQPYVIHTLFPTAPDTGVLKLNYHLKYDTKLNNNTQSLVIDRTIDFQVQSGEINGEVKDENGRCFQDVPITAKIGNETLTTTTNSTGAYNFNDLKSGNYTITATGRNGYSFVVKTGSSMVQLSNSAGDKSSYQKQVDFLYDGTLIKNIDILNLTGDSDHSSQCIPQGIAYAKIKFTLNRQVSTMVIDLNTTINNVLTDYSLKSVTLVNNTTGVASSYQVVGHQLIMPNNLPSGSYELAISFDLGKLVVPGDTVQMNILDLMTTEAGVTATDKVTPSGNPLLFTNSSLPITIEPPLSIL